MKRLIIFTLALVFFTSSALASVDDLIAEHNVACIATGAAQITGDPEISEGRYIFSITDQVKIHFNMDGETFKSFSCVCLDDSGIGEFLAQCVASFYTLGGIDAYSSCYGPVLMDFLSVRSGFPAGNNSSVSGLLFRIVRESYGYTFIIVKVK